MMNMVIVMLQEMGLIPVQEIQQIGVHIAMAQGIIIVYAKMFPISGKHLITNVLNVVKYIGQEHLTCVPAEDAEVPCANNQ